MSRASDLGACSQHTEAARGAKKGFWRYGCSVSTSEHTLHAAFAWDGLYSRKCHAGEVSTQLSPLPDRGSYHHPMSTDNLMAVPQKRSLVEFNHQLFTSVTACPGKCNYSGPSSKAPVTLCSPAWLCTQPPAGTAGCLHFSCSSNFSPHTCTWTRHLRYLLGCYQNHPSSRANALSF